VKTQNRISRWIVENAPPPYRVPLKPSNM